MLSQLLAVAIFVLMFFNLVAGKIDRWLVTLTAGILTIAVVFLFAMHSPEAVEKALSLKSFGEYQFWYAGQGAAGEVNAGINWSTVLFIAGMMIMVEGMSDAGFFDWLCLCLAKLVHYQAVPLLLCFMVLSAVLSMFIDSITVILFLAATSIQLAKVLRFDPVPLILAEVFTANLGGAATMSGDPPNIIIGTSLGLTFGAFLRNTGIIVLVCLILILPYFYFCFREELAGSGRSQPPAGGYPIPRDAIVNRGQFAVSVGIFFVTVVLLVTHAQNGLTVATIGALAALATLTAAPKGPWQLLRRLDWRTLLFFIGLFLTVSGLEQTGVLHQIARWIASVSGGSPTAMIVMVLWISAVASAFVDNIPFAATMVPVITSLAATQGVDLNTLAWTLSLGTDIGGSATPIGASANVVATAIAAREGYLIGWKRYCTYAVPATVMVIAVSMLLLLARS